MLEALQTQLLIRQCTIIVALLGGILSLYLGYRLLILGVTGAFKFKSDIKGLKADVVSASPGIFFALVGAFIVWTSLRHGMDITVAGTPINVIRHKHSSPNTSPDFDSDFQSQDLKPGDVIPISFSVHNMCAEPENYTIIFSECPTNSPTGKRPKQESGSIVK